MIAAPRLRHTVFARCPWLFYAAVLLMLSFFALALVHEAIPGLCSAQGGDAATCPFCNLIHVLALAATAFIYAQLAGMANPRPGALALFPPAPVLYPPHIPRAPPLPCLTPAS